MNLSLLMDFLNRALPSPVMATIVAPASFTAALAALGLAGWLKSLSENPIGAMMAWFFALGKACVRGNTRGGISPSRRTPPRAKRHATLAGTASSALPPRSSRGPRPRGYWPPRAPCGQGRIRRVMVQAGFRIGSKRRAGWPTGYTRKVFHFLIFGTAAAVQAVWGLPALCLFGSATSLVIFIAVWRGSGNLLYEAMAREKDTPHRTYYILAPYAATLLGGLASNMFFSRTAIFGYLVTGLGDAIGEPVGTRFGRHSYRVPAWGGVKSVRTLEGSAAVFVACMAALLLGTFLCPTVLPREHLGWMIPFFSLAFTLCEALAPHGWDNALLQIVPAGLLSLISS